MIVLVDYGAGNIFSVTNALREICAEFAVSNDPAKVEQAERVLLPGVGHFAQMMGELDRLRFRDPLIEFAQSGRPLLGICLGMQALFESSEEAPRVRGLGLLEGHVKRFPNNARVPHMGWNDARFSEGRDWFYFANSFYVPSGEATWAETEYGLTFASAVKQGNVVGFQFHPEKSGRAGLRLLRNWCFDAG